ncbi:ABC transporter ATP-binding protein [Corynebacterium phocae]|uniref:ABC transporter ATP-binding protein n=1 Tax=Corynebacterium phocae TaxID=161895 RepID=A0A1L7D3K1_9CORY|nr:ABC transporter ATP-binding protein [Corynebacterium phocae]APT92647.1 ABC transporter ATP-binding protein [Corynebacterium phocae]KAA8723892.1 ABC transporter ATP-binding protein [Corynebacterium phocae]
MSAVRNADALAPATMRRSVAFLRGLPAAPTRAKVIGWVALIILAVVSMNLSALLLGRMVDLANGTPVAVLGSGRGALVAALSIVAITMLIEATVRVMTSFALSYSVRKQAVSLRKAALEAVLRAPVPDVMALGTGNVLTRLSKDINTTVNTLSKIGGRLAITLLVLPVTALTVGLIHPLYLLLFLVVGIIMYPWVRTIVHDIPVLTNVVSSVEASRNNVLVDTIRALETLHQFSWTGWAKHRMEAHSWETVQAWGDRTPLFTRILGQGYLAFSLLLLGSFSMGVPMVHYGLVTPGEAAAAVLLMMRLEIHVFNVLSFSGEIQHAATALGRAVALAAMSAPREGEIPPALDRAPAVQFENLSYSYPGGGAVISDLSLTLEAGTTTALVGTSGAGKSTLAATMAGLQYPTSGRILVGGVDIATVPNTWVTQHVALVTQEVHLFSGTLRDDLLLAAPGASDDSLLAALAAVGLTPSSVSWQRWLPRGLDTLIGSGNEEVGPDVAQQISLARMVLRQPPVLVMDEATSEAGSEHAQVLEEAARAVTAGRTSLVVAHRLDQARDADRIIVMEAGRIVEDGNHNSLVALDGRYAKAYKQWEQGS